MDEEGKGLTEANEGNKGDAEARKKLKSNRRSLRTATNRAKQREEARFSLAFRLR
jgi:hypothetical protein